jgi:hypothetical protein
MTDLEIYEAFKKLYWKAKEKGDQEVADMQQKLKGHLGAFFIEWPDGLKEHLIEAVHSYFNEYPLSRSKGLDKAWDSVYQMLENEKKSPIKMELLLDDHQVKYLEEKE